MDLERLVRHGKALSPDMVFKNLRQGYRFLTEMDSDEALLSGDSYQRERKTYQRLLTSF